MADELADKMASEDGIRVYGWFVHGGLTTPGSFVIDDIRNKVITVAENGLRDLHPELMENPERKCGPMKGDNMTGDRLGIIDNPDKTEVIFVYDRAEWVGPGVDDFLDEDGITYRFAVLPRAEAEKLIAEATSDNCDNGH
jgi:hypothetical protein